MRVPFDELAGNVGLGLKAKFRKSRGQDWAALAKVWESEDTPNSTKTTRPGRDGTLAFGEKYLKNEEQMTRKYK